MAEPVAYIKIATTIDAFPGKSVFLGTHLHGWTELSKVDSGFVKASGWVGHAKLPVAMTVYRVTARSIPAVNLGITRKSVFSMVSVLFPTHTGPSTQTTDAKTGAQTRTAIAYKQVEHRFHKVQFLASEGDQGAVTYSFIAEKNVFDVQAAGKWQETDSFAAS